MCVCMLHSISSHCNMAILSNLQSTADNRLIYFLHFLGHYDSRSAQRPKAAMIPVDQPPLPRDCRLQI